MSGRVKFEAPCGNKVTFHSDSDGDIIVEIEDYEQDVYCWLVTYHDIPKLMEFLSDVYNGKGGDDE